MYSLRMCFVLIPSPNLVNNHNFSGISISFQRIVFKQIALSSYRWLELFVLLESNVNLPSDVNPDMQVLICILRHEYAKFEHFRIYVDILPTTTSENIRHWQLLRWWRFGFTSWTGTNGIWYRRWDIWWELAENWGGWAHLAQQELRITPSSRYIMYIKLEWLKWLSWLRELIGLIGLIDPIEVIKLLSINSINLQGLLMMLVYTCTTVYAEIPIYHWQPC